MNKFAVIEVNDLRWLTIKKQAIRFYPATARKIAVIMRNMIVKRTHYNPVNTLEYIQEIKAKKIKQINIKMKKYEIETISLSSV